MFESPASTRQPLLTLDPWSTDYGSAIGFEDEEEDEPSKYEVDPFVETQGWSAGITPQPRPFPESVAFIDGVQRTECFARVDDGDSLAEAVLASVSAGAVVSRAGKATLTCEFVSRVLAVAGPTAANPLVVPQRNNDLVYEVVRSPQTGRRAAMQAVSIRRRDLELACIQKLLAHHPLVIADGRLDRAEPAANQLAGVAKTLHQLYVAGEQRALIARLRAGERTPVFLIKDSWGSRFSWFLRLPYTRAIHHSYAGIVRLEIPDDPSRSFTDVADMLSHNLPRFASKPEHDPRAPQNLLPVGGLERQLRHEMGDPAYIRRAIEDHLMREALA
jgi:hypothetical protein